MLAVKMCEPSCWNDQENQRTLERASSSVTPRMPFSSPSLAVRSAEIISEYSAGVFRLTVRSTTDTSTVGTRNAIPVSFPSRSGSTCETFHYTSDAPLHLECASMSYPQVLALLQAKQLKSRH